MEPNLIEEIRYYGVIAHKLEQSEDPESKGAFNYFKSKLDELVKKYVMEGENVA